MSPELDERLCQKYPKIFSQRWHSPSVTCMCWGFEVADGWYNLIDTLCGEIQRRIDHTRKIRARKLRLKRARDRALQIGSYMPIMNMLYGHFRKHPGQAVEWQDWQISEAKRVMDTGVEVPEAVRQVVATQVKEKYGTLRFYYDGGDDTVDAMVQFAESFSGKICEICGDPAEVRGEGGGGWVATRCALHAQDLNPTLKKTVEVRADETGELFIELSEEIMAAAGMSAGDTVEWTPMPDGSVVISKKD